MMSSGLDRAVAARNDSLVTILLPAIFKAGISAARSAINRRSEG
jgi:hypothetical protein